MKKKLLLFAAMLLFSSNSHATRYYVNASATGNGNGLTWVNAFTSLQAAISATIAGDEIWAATGTYKPGTSRSASFVMKNGVNLYGGFAGTETMLSERNIATAPTTLSGDIGTLGNNNDNSYKVMKIENITIGITLDGFRIVSGYNQNDGSEGAGAFIQDNPGIITIKNCIFYDNYAYGYGGGLFIDQSDVNFENCEFLYNSNFDYGGGAIYASNVSGSNITLIKCKFVGNTSRSGAAISFDGPNLIIDRTVFCGNAATSYSIIGVGPTQTFKMTNCLVVGNQFGGSYGTLMSISPPNANSCYLVNNTICHNKSTTPDAMLYPGIRTLNNGAHFRNCIIYDNHTSGAYQLPSTNYTANNILSGSLPTGTNNVFTDPLFANPGSLAGAPFDSSAFDYSLTSSSPGINSGNATYLIAGYNTLDLNGNERIQQGVVDRGAIESPFLSTPEHVLGAADYIFSDGVLTFKNIDDFAGKDLTIYNMRGQSVHSVRIEENGIRLNLTSGLYFVSIDNKSIAKKIIVP
ncbi:T9SS type A sorting domain-containing protein [Flavobacterium sp. MAH-1]|uniref:T9SS type A sorting domain-containing protein n=1 Tax=Flavobacterium agri TaxID=2743471 RepID=A0A7Y8Y1Y0_9FLAO|nr:T9SS type A sorting domain-containing protein [Flavobacterium agri]NUY81072.1 T9SS type A sorting domain-containing protein [Flavobacterium agri]NYA71096.1 T9SS type A sorting domain-containing protein [Flavobacterium agri]